MSLKILMIVSSGNNNRCQYFPMDSPQELINEIAEVSNRMKTILSKGIIETNRNKFAYQHFLPKEINEENEDILAQDYPVIFICSDKLYQNNKIDLIFKEIFNCLNEKEQKNTKISNEEKTQIARIFLKYKKMNDIKESDSNETEFGVIEEFTGFDMKSFTTSSCYEASDTMNLNDPKKKSRMRNLEKKRRKEIENIKKWKKIKLIYLFISIILLIATIISIIGFKNELFG